MTDEEIMDMLMRGEEDAIIYFDQRYRSKIIGFGIRQFGMSKDEAEDLAQEVTVRIWSSSRSLKNNKSLSGLVNTIASNYAIDLHRRKKVANIASDVDVYSSAIADLSDISDPEIMAIRSDEQRRAKIAVDKILSSIKPIYADALVKAYLAGNGACLREIAPAMGIGTTTLKSILFKARAAARRVMEEKDVEGRPDYPAA